VPQRVAERRYGVHGPPGLSLKSCCPNVVHSEAHLWIGDTRLEAHGLMEDFIAEYRAVKEEVQALDERG
jgi:hypothetical protein